ncbi:amino acid transporter [Gonapodya prolifera JEL478]|uniref:Amino acid transporter n=1 Tax=Gonapodya prolifera (strain JEL478) TaxID=1344416 RepID=A0A139A1V6_GONPJ|nr:amino acid transporter [Gonapodya prolifera JEL478]|eukprot:KXS10525.1 amino acid transporter [Gonapodya prolifera JEL478]
MATTGMTDDEIQLAKLGYRQELKRSWGFFLNMGTSLGYIGIISSIVTLYSFAFKTGGPQAMLIGWPIVSFFSMSTCLSMAEICSAYPTAGGLYYWSAKLAGDKWGPYMAWITGWFNILGMLAGSPAVCLQVASILAAAIQIYNPDFVPSLGWLYGVAIVYAFLGSATNSIGETLLRIFTWISLVGIATGVVVIGVPLLVMSPTKASASFAFGTLVDKTGWGNSTLVFQLGFLLPLWCFWGYDASAHISEETVNADTTPAKSIIYSLVLSIILGYIFLIILNFVVTDINEILDCPYNEDLVCVYLQGTGGSKPMALLLTIWTLFQFVFNTITGHNGASRALYAWARDGAIPQWFAYVHPESKQPLRTIWVHFFFTATLMLINFGSSQAVNSFSAFSTMGMYAAYTIPTICKLIWARDTFKKSKINLGSFSTIINIIAALWLVYLVVILSIPRRMPIVRTNLNLSPIMFVGVFLVINVIWLLGAKKTFTGPRQHITAEEVEEMEKAKHEKIEM